MVLMTSQSIGLSPEVVAHHPLQLQFYGDEGQLMIKIQHTDVYQLRDESNLEADVSGYACL